MEKFSVIYNRAVKRKEGKKELELLLPTAAKQQELISKADSEYLAAMTKKIFQSGFIWRVVESKWQGFEEVFWGFEPFKLELASDEQIERMAQDTRIIRNFTKVKSVRDNAFLVKEISDKHDGFGKFIANWPVEEITLLWKFLKKHGSRLGGNTGPYFLRSVAKDTFLLTRDVVGYLVAQGLIAKHPTSQKDLNLVQTAFNNWQQQSGRSMSEISKVVACSIG